MPSTSIERPSSPDKIFLGGYPRIGAVTRGSPFESIFFGHLRRIVVLFNENERGKWPKELFRTSAWMHVGRAMH